MDWNVDSLLNIFNILGILIIVFNLMGIFKVYYKRQKLQKHFNGNFETIPEKLPQRSFWNKAAILLWSFVFIISLAQIIFKGYFELTPDFISPEIIGLFALTFVINKYMQKDEFAEYALNIPVFYDEKGFILHPRGSFIDFEYYKWNRIKDFNTTSSQYYGYFDITFNLDDGKKKKIFVDENEKIQIERLASSKMGK